MAGEGVTSSLQQQAGIRCCKDGRAFSTTRRRRQGLSAVDGAIQLARESHARQTRRRLHVQASGKRCELGIANCPKRHARPNGLRFILTRFT
jgi:hypothetical protein